MAGNLEIIRVNFASKCSFPTILKKTLFGMNIFSLRGPVFLFNSSTIEQTAAAMSPSSAQISEAVLAIRSNKESSKARSVSNILLILVYCLIAHSRNQ